MQIIKKKSSFYSFDLFFCLFHIRSWLRLPGARRSVFSPVPGYSLTIIYQRWHSAAHDTVWGSQWLSSILTVELWSCSPQKVRKQGTHLHAAAAGGQLCCLACVLLKRSQQGLFSSRSYLMLNKRGQAWGNLWVARGVWKKCHISTKRARWVLFSQLLGVKCGPVSRKKKNFYSLL